MFSVRWRTKSTFYIIQVKLDDTSLFLLWYDDENISGLVTNEYSKMIAFKQIENLLRYAREKSFRLVDDTPDCAYDFGALDTWCNKPTAALIDCKKFLTSWNLLEDFLGSVSGTICKLEVDRYFDVYSKLFAGCNYPAINHGSEYIPEWSSEDIDKIVKCLSNGIKFVREHLVVLD